MVEVEHASHEVKWEVVHGPGHEQPRTNPHIAIQTDWEEERGVESEAT